MLSKNDFQQTVGQTLTLYILLWKMEKCIWAWYNRWINRTKEQLTRLKFKPFWHVLWSSSDHLYVSMNWMQTLITSSLDLLRHGVGNISRYFGYFKFSIQKNICSLERWVECKSLQLKIDSNVQRKTTKRKQEEEKRRKT